MEDPAKKIIVADASPLIVLARINHLFLLESLFKDIYISSDVANECFLDNSRPGAKIIHHAVENKKIKIYTAKVPETVIDLPPLLGVGERTAINLACHLKAMLLIDDLWGRKIAKKNDITILGTAGLLLLAKNYKVISKIKPLLKKLDDCNFRLSKNLTNKILVLANETKL